MSTSERVLTEEMIDAIRAYFPRYPTRRAVTLPALHVVNEHLRHVPLAAVVEIAELLELAPAEVQDTLTFYRFFRQDQPHGKVRAWICQSLSCALRDGENLSEYLCERAGVRPGETTADGRLTVEAAECLGACDFAPCMLVGDRLIKDLTREKIDRLLREHGIEETSE